MALVLFQDKLHILLLEFGLLIHPLNRKCVPLIQLYNFDITNIIFKCICIVLLELCSAYFYWRRGLYFFNVFSAIIF